MGIYESVRTRICNGKLDDIKKRHLYLAYIRLHMTYPGLHPDDYLSHEGGYEGWHVLLVNKVMEGDSLKDEFHYPCSFLKLEETLNELEGFHTDLMNDTGGKEHIVEKELLMYVNDITFWLDEMKPTELDGIVDALQKLYLHHANENDTNEEEAEKPADVLKDCADVLNWIMHF